jgi:hypothetical protein
MGDLGIDQVLMMLIQEDQKQEQEIRRDRLRSLLMPKPQALAAPDLIVVRPHCNLPQQEPAGSRYYLSNGASRSWR